MLSSRTQLYLVVQKYTLNDSVVTSKTLAAIFFHPRILFVCGKSCKSSENSLLYSVEVVQVNLEKPVGMNLNNFLQS